MVVANRSKQRVQGARSVVERSARRLSRRAHTGSIHRKHTSGHSISQQTCPCAISFSRLYEPSSEALVPNVAAVIDPPEGIRRSDINVSVHRDGRNCNMSAYGGTVLLAGKMSRLEEASNT